MKKSYKEFKKVYIGESDIATLIVRTCENYEVTKENYSKWGVYSLNFGKDSNYNAYVVDETAIIGEHYNLVIHGKAWIKIYDDEGLTFKARAKEIKIYRAGQHGCIIQLIEEEGEKV